MILQWIYLTGYTKGLIEKAIEPAENYGDLDRLNEAYKQLYCMYV